MQSQSSSQNSQNPHDVFQHLWNQVYSTINPGQLEVREFNEGELYDERLDLEVDELELTLPNCVPNESPEFMAQPQRYPSIDSGAPPSDITSEVTRSPGTNSVRSPVPGPQNGAASQTLPSNTVWPGEHNFQISLEPCGEHAEKSISWTYSTTLNKLYIDREKVCPINMKTEFPPPDGTIVRVMPIFQKVSFMQEIVKCCPHHVGKDEEHANHVVVCLDPHTTYETDPVTGRYSLTIPLSTPQAGNNYCQYLFMFKCFTSCVGGLNRRPIQLLFTLENNGAILGRQVLDTRVCACPGRDRKADERNKEKPKKGSKRTKQYTSTLEVTTVKAKKQKVDKEVFFLRVEGREKYEILLKIKEALDLKDQVSDEKKEAYFRREEQLAQLPMPSHSSGSSTTGGSQTGTAGQVSSQQCLPPQPLLQQMQPVEQQLLMPQQNHQPSQSVSMNQQPLSTVSSTSFSDLLSQPMFPTTSQPFDVAPVSTQESDQGFTALQSLPSLSRGDTLPVLTNISPSLQHYLMADQPDGTPAMDMTPNQRFDQQSPTEQRTSPPSTLQTCQVTSSMQDNSIQGWLDGLGCGQYVRTFQDKGFNTIDSLEDIQYEFFNEFSISQQDRETIWKSILEHKNRQQHLKSTPPFTRDRSNASTVSHHSTMGGSQGQVVRATRYTLRQTFSFKVEKEDEEDEQ